MTRFRRRADFLSERASRGTLPHQTRRAPRRAFPLLGHFSTEVPALRRARVLDCAALGVQLGGRDCRKGGHAGLGLAEHGNALADVYDGRLGLT